jgi:hypothetical protein
MGVSSLEGSLGYTGYEGMNSWIVRPLLDVGKVIIDPSLGVCALLFNLGQNSCDM